MVQLWRKRGQTVFMALIHQIKMSCFSTSKVQNTNLKISFVDIKKKNTHKAIAIANVEVI